MDFAFEDRQIIVYQILSVITQLRNQTTNLIRQICVPFYIRHEIETSRSNT